MRYNIAVKKTSNISISSQSFYLFRIISKIIFFFTIIQVFIRPSWGLKFRDSSQYKNQRSGLKSGSS